MAENPSYAMFLEIKGRLCIPLELGQVYMLGKEIHDVKKSKNFIELKEEKELSQRHCVIDISHNEDAHVFDLLSLKGTLLNNKPLISLEKKRLRNGDILTLGNQEIKYVCGGHEVSRDSSGFLDVNKNTSDIIASSPNTSSLLESRITGINHNFLVPSIQNRKSAATPNKSLSLQETESNDSKISLNTSSSSLVTNNRRSDSFTIPETQYCKQPNTLNASDLSAADNIPNGRGEKIKFNFGNLDSFDDDDDEFCIPETQEVLPVGVISSSERPCMNSTVQNEAKEKLCLEEVSSRSVAESNLGNSQFRICTQDYNEGFGEEESVQDMPSQIIPLIKHPMISFNNTMQCPNENSITQNESEMSELKGPNSKVDQETLILRTDCPTPDIFDFEGQEPVNKQDVKSNNIKTSTDLDANLVDEDEEDLLPTQAIPPQFIAKAGDSKNLNQLDKPCLEEENEEVLTLSDKENRCPVGLAAITDLPPTQLFESRTNSSNTIKLNSSAINSNTTTSVLNNGAKSLLNNELDEEDNLLTQAFLQPPDAPISSTRSDGIVFTKNPDIYIDEIMESSLKESSPATGFKMPAKDFNGLKKNSSSTSETDLDLLMCTPQLIKDNIFVGKTEDLKQNILAAKNNLFGDETDEEDDDEQGDLVKLINVPKDSLDFDKLLPHLNRKQNCNKISEEQRAATEARKIYKFNISFNKELDEKQSKTSVSKSSSFDRDERHAARDKGKEITEHKQPTKTRNKKGQNRNKGKKEKETVDRKKDTETKETSNTDKATNEKKIKQDNTVITTEKVEEESTNQQKKVTRLRKRNTPSDITEKERQSTTDDETQKIPARRVTRFMSKCDETVNKEVVGKRTKTTQNKKDNLNSNAAQPIVRVARCRSVSKTNNESQDSVTSNNSSHKNESYQKESKYDASLHSIVSGNVNTTSKKVVERKRKGTADDQAAAGPKESKRLRNSSKESQSSSSAAAISISMTMVDQELFKNLVNDSKGLWNISKNITDCDILVMDKAYRTFKFLLAMARGIPIVTSEYLRKLNETKSSKKVEISDYLFADEEFEKKHKFSLVKSLQAAKKNKIFKGYEFVMTSSILPNPQEIKAIIEASGGCVHHKNPPQPKENQKLYLVTSKEDKKDWHKYRRLNKNIIIVSTEAIMSAVMSQNCERMTKYTLA